MSKRVAPRHPVATATAFPLPIDLAEASVARLRWVALGLSGSMACVYFVGKVANSGWIDPDHAPLSYHLAILLTVILGLAVFVAAHSRRISPYLMLDIALVFQVAGGFLISLAENAVPRLPGEIIRGHSSVAVWIAFFVLAVPTSFGKSALAAGVTACMGPAGLAAQVLLGNVANPAAAVWLFPFASSFIMAAGAATLARFMYDLGAQVSEARELGSYQLVERLDSGGMGEVWRARHRMLARQAAVKLIRTDAAGAESVRRFEREAQATASLQSPHTVTLYDYGVNEDGRFYYVMELLDGISLDALVRKYGPLPAARAVYILEQACDSLLEAHTNDLVHRDVKPGNILLCHLGNSYDFVKVLDFGLVKHSTGEYSQLTREGTAAGTPAFLSPEAAQGKTGIDARADLYSLGCVAYWLLTGRLVFEGENAMAIALAHLGSRPLPPSEVTDNEIPPDFEQLIMDCLEKDPGRRPQSARLVADRLAACRAGAPWNAQRAEQWWRTHQPENR